MNAPCGADDRGNADARLHLATGDWLLDDSTLAGLEARCGARWRAVDDRVMGGVSVARVRRGVTAGRPAVTLEGAVRLDNNGGFVQMALDLPSGRNVPALERFAGLAMEVRGNGERYGVHLRTSALERPWQSYRTEFLAAPAWRTLWLPFAGFRPHRTDLPFDPSGLRRLGIAAIGRSFTAEVSVARLALRVAPPATWRGPGAGSL